MANFVLNNFVYVNDEDKFEELVFKGNDIDFNVLVPMPVEMQISSGSTSYREIPPVSSYSEGSIGDINYNIIKNLEPTLERLYNDKISQEDFAEQVFNETEGDEYFKWYNVPNDVQDKSIKLKAKGYWNLQRYGEIDWFDWSRVNWGTKWNAETLSEREFYTAWSTPYYWLKELGKHIDFIMYFADEDLGSNFGFVVAKNGITEIYHYENVDANRNILKYIIIALYLRNEYNDTEDLIEQLVERFEETEEVAKEYAEKADEFIAEFEQKAQFYYDNFNSEVV